MPLCKPTPEPLLNGLFWKEIHRSNFLSMQEHKPGPRLGEMFRISLLHNGYVIALASKKEEIDKLWELCEKFAEMAKAGTRLVALFEDLWKEYEQNKQEYLKNPAAYTDNTQLFQDLLQFTDKNSVRISTTDRKPIPLSDVLSQTEEDIDQDTESIHSSHSSIDFDKVLQSRTIFSEQEEHVIRQLLTVAKKPLSIVLNNSSSESIHPVLVRAVRNHSPPIQLNASKTHSTNNDLLTFQKMDLLLAYPTIIKSGNEQFWYGKTLKQQGFFDHSACVVIFDNFGKEKSPSSSLRNLSATSLQAERYERSDDDDNVHAPINSLNKNEAQRLRNSSSSSNGSNNSDNSERKSGSLASRSEASLNSPLGNKNQSFADIPLKGWLRKRGYWISREWKKRWFVLDPRTARLYYYATQADEKKNNFRGFINLSDVTTVHESFFPGSINQKGEWPFEIHTPQREWLLNASRKQEMEMWINQINDMALYHDHKKQTRNTSYRSKVLHRNNEFNLLTTTKPGQRLPPRTPLNGSGGSIKSFSNMSLSGSKDTSININNKGNSSNNGNSSSNNGSARVGSLVGSLSDFIPQMNHDAPLDDELNSEYSVPFTDAGSVANGYDTDFEESEIMKMRKKADFVSEKKQGHSLFYAADDFSAFGAPDGECVLNKDTALAEIDRYLGYKDPPDVEYVYVEPYLNYASEKLYITANPYGHAVVRYTLPDTKEQLLMNIVGLADHELVNFLDPTDFFFSTNFDTKIGNEQGGIYNRNFASVRVQRVPPEKILAMHQYFLDLHSRSHKNWADYNILLGPILNRASTVSYGNCAHWCSQGLRQAGLLNKTSMFPKSIWTSMFEILKLENPHEIISNNISVVYYKRVLHAKRFYGEDADWAGWGRPTDYFKTKYNNLELYADAIVYVPDGQKHTVIKSGRLSSLYKRSLRRQKMKTLGKIELRFDVHVEPRVLYNESFYTRVSTKTLELVPISNELEPANMNETPLYKLIACGYPLTSNCWLVDNDNQLFRTAPTDEASDSVLTDRKRIQWVPFSSPTVAFDPYLIEEKQEGESSENSEAEKSRKPVVSLIAPGEDGTCWIVCDKKLFVIYGKTGVDGHDVQNEETEWKQVPAPSAGVVIAISLTTVENGVWVVDDHGCLFLWNPTDLSWSQEYNAPKFACISVGHNKELWGVTPERAVFRLRHNQGAGGNTWVQIHGALLQSISVVSNEEVWGVDQEGQVYIWSSHNHNDAFIEDVDQGLPFGAHGGDAAIFGDDHFDSSNYSKLSWQKMGNMLPVRKISINMNRIPWAISDYDSSCFYKLSTHRLLIVSTMSCRKIWDDRKSGCNPFRVGFWRPTPPKGFYSLGDIAERSYLENPSTEAVVVREIGAQPGEISILAAPIGYRRLWAFKGGRSNYGDCCLWEPIPPSDDYVAMGHLATAGNKEPSPNAVRCVHRKFLKQSAPCSLSRKYNYLWSSHGSLLSQATTPVSVWLVKPRVDSIWSNSFFVSKGETPPPAEMCVCLKMSVVQ